MSPEQIPVTASGARKDHDTADPTKAPQEPNVIASGATTRDANQDLEALQGTWRSIAMVIDGRRIPAAALEHRRVIITGDKYVVVDGERTLRRGTFRFDSATAPKQIDALPADGPNVGKFDRGIYELATDILQVCWAPPGRPRPTNFAPEPGSKQWMATDQRVPQTMMAELSRVVAEPCECPGSPGLYTTRVHHCDFPELHGEGETPYEAALNLLQHLISDAGVIADGWHRGVLEQVIADVRAFVDQVS
jgi:uncharacterized protein (TIGR03067 family)